MLKKLSKEKTFIENNEEVFEKVSNIYFILSSDKPKKIKVQQTNAKYIG